MLFVSTNTKDMGKEIRSLRKQMNIYIYNFDNFEVRPGGFEEATAAEDKFWETIYGSHNIVEAIELADIALIKINNASLFYAQEELATIWRNHIIPHIKQTNIIHATLFSYVLYNIDLSFIPSWIKIFCYESEVTIPNSIETKNMGTDNRMCVIPYILEPQTNPAAGLVHKSVIKQEAFSFDDWKICEEFAFIGSSGDSNRPMITSRQELVYRWKELFGCTIYSNRENEEPNEIYLNHKFALILRGDTPTRKAFYQALNAGCFPIITESAWKTYSELFRGNIKDLKSFVLVISDNKDDWNKLKIQKQIEDIKSNAEILLSKMKKWATELLHYDSNMINHALKSLTQPTIRNNKLLYVYELDKTEYQPTWVQVSDEEVITTETFKQSQYCLEKQLDEFCEKYPYKTDFLEKADFAIVPVFTFLSCWKTPKHYSVNDCVNCLQKLMQENPSWKSSLVPHFIAYGDVLWDDDRVFLGRMHLPENTTVICLEASNHPTKQIAVPYPCEAFPVENMKRNLAVYVGRQRDSMQKYPITIHEINTNGWHSTNTRNEEIHKTYNMHKFSFQPHGDRATRRGFYQSIMGKCVPVITKDCVSAYSNALGHDVSDFCIVVDNWDSSVIDVIENADYEELSKKLPTIDLGKSIENIFKA